MEKIIRTIIRRRDLLDLFDTTPDICGQDLDISRYIRDGEDNDVQFFWRDIGEGGRPGEHEPQPSREELCRVSIGEAAKFLKDDKKTRAWRWNPLEKKWEIAKSGRPGGVYLIASSSGGYEDALGWTGEAKAGQFALHRPPDEESESHDSDGNSFNRRWLELGRHTLDVVAETDRITSALHLSTEESAALHTAALWHDVGKAHEIFQAMLWNGDASRKGTLWAKSESRYGKSARRGFRHELASALAWLLIASDNVSKRDLVAYLIAAHHGKIRLSIRSLPDEKGNPDAPEALFARGIWQGDKLPPASLGELKTPEISLDLSFMQMGEGPHGPSWLARTIALRDQVGPFRLAALETLLRAADARASAIGDLTQ
jgi:CRISPR-associated endonuclease/helicase Cas3